jgi:sulfur carrier protein
MINITINGNHEKLDKSINIKELLIIYNRKSPLTVVELNGTVVPETQFDKTTVKEDDVVEIIQLMGGG